jgi:hypothetical protein
MCLPKRRQFEKMLFYPANFVPVAKPRIKKS